MRKFIDSKLWKRIKRNKWFYEIYTKSLAKYVKKSRLRPRLKAVQEEGESVIFEIENALSETNVSFFVDNGTLLGFVRSGEVIKWDYDIDFGIYLSDSFKWKDLEICMRGLGFDKFHQYRFDGMVTEQTYRKGNISVDFFSHFDDENNTYFYSFYNIPNYQYSVENQVHVNIFKTVKLTGTKALKVKQGIVHIPNEAEKYLAGLYGDTWRIPNPNWIEGSGPDCYKVENEFGYCEKFVVE